MHSSVRQWIKVFARLVLAALGVAFLVQTRPMVSITANGVCLTEEQRTLSSMPGLTFTVEDLRCGFRGVQVWTISIARSAGLLSWLGLGKTEIFRGFGDSDAEPVVTAIDPHTVRISINWVGETIFAKDRWQDITILYDIDKIAHPSENDPPRR